MEKLFEIGTMTCVTPTPAVSHSMAEFPEYCSKVTNSSSTFHVFLSEIRSGFIREESLKRSLTFDCTFSSAFIYRTCPVSSPACLVLNASKPLWKETSSCLVLSQNHRKAETGSGRDHLSSIPLWNWCLRLIYPGSCQAKSGLFSVKEIPPLLWATISNAELFSQWIFFLISRSHFPGSDLCLLPLVLLLCIPVNTVFLCTLPTFPKLPFGC